MFTTSVIYIHEVVDPEIRGALSSVPFCFLVLGSFSGTLLGAIVPWYTATEIAYSLAGTLPPVNLTLF